MYYFILVDAGNRAVIFDKIQGVKQLVVGEGTHFKIPFIQVSLFCSIVFYFYILDMCITIYRFLS